MSYLVKAIKQLKPTAEFSFTEEDYASIKWDVLEGNPPTQAQIDAAIVEIKADEAKAEADKAATKLLAESKLKALGLTTDDLKALGLGGN